MVVEIVSGVFDCGDSFHVVRIGGIVVGNTGFHSQKVSGKVKMFMIK